MGRKILYFGAGGLILLGLLMSCTISGMSDVELAKELMKESADATGLYPEPVGSKTFSSKGAGLSITIDLPDGNPPETGPYTVTLTFDDYIPSFAPNSLVNGVLTATVWLDLEPSIRTVTIAFYGDLIVMGEHEGTYHFEAELIIDLSTGEYGYSEYITIDGKKYKTG